MPRWGTQSADNRIGMNVWLGNIAQTMTQKEISDHIIKHADELDGNEDPNLWAASMRNLLDIYESKHGISPLVIVRLERLQHKYDSNKEYYTPPPKSLSDPRD